MGEIQELKANVEEKENQIQKQKTEIIGLRNQNGGLAYQLNEAKEFEQNYKNLQKSMEPLKNNIKSNNAELKICVEKYEKIKKEHHVLRENFKQKETKYLNTIQATRMIHKSIIAEMEGEMRKKDEEMDSLKLMYQKST